MSAPTTTFGSLRYDDFLTMQGDPGQITRLLVEWKQGDAEALSQIVELYYDELRGLARNYLRGIETPTLPSRALVHELYLKLNEGVEVDFRNRAHFVALAARMIRNISVDYIRSQKAGKRGGDLMRVELPADLGTDGPNLELLVLDDALRRLHAKDPRCAELVELRFFGGLSVAEIAETLEISEATVKRDWVFAKTWLLAEVAGTAGRNPIDGSSPTT
jgi:RNA polymerase sigma factor (TIGR02999 family)